MLILLLSLTLFIITGIMGVLILLIWKYRPASGDRTSRIILASVVLGCSLSTVSYGTELLVPDLSTKLICVFLRYAGGLLLITATVFFSLWYLGRLDRVSRKVAVAICIPPVVMLIALATDSLHHLFYPQLWLAPVDGTFQLHHTMGPLYIIAQMVVILYVGAGFVLLVGARFLGPRAYGRAGIVVFFGLLVPVLGYFLYLAGVRPFGFLNITLYCFSVTAICLTLATVRFRILDLRPIAHSALIRNLPAGMVVIDDRLRVLEVNPAAAAMLGYPAQSLINQPVTGLFPDDDPGRNLFLTGGPSDAVIHRNGRYLHLTLAPLADRETETIGHLLLLQDITESRQSAEALRQMNRKLQTLSEITRHDILNQLTALRGLLELDLERAPEPEKAARIRRELQIADTINAMILFTRQFEEIGGKEPQWVMLSTLVPPVYGYANAQGVELEDALGQYEIYTDPLISKAVFNLVDNAIRHGKNVKRIRFATRRDGQALLIACEDDGTGIPDGMKEKIFWRGVGKNTGLGLFFVREILSTTGISITEEGTPGEGARFIIRVPPGKFREIR